MNTFAQEESLLDLLDRLQMNSKVPTDIAKTYFGAKPDYYGEIQPIDLEYYKRGEDNSVVILKFYTGVEEYSLLKLLDGKGIFKNKEYLIMRNADHDGSYALAESINYQFINDSIIELIDRKEMVKDTSMYDSKTNWINGDKSFWDLETITFYNYRYIKINSDNTISNLKPNNDISADRKYKQVSERILSKKELVKFSQKQLRLMRNEIFADYGYIFNSKDLNEYFTSKLWYHPKYETVSFKLSYIEKVNIKTILELEKR